MHTVDETSEEYGRFDELADDIEQDKGTSFLKL